VHGLAHVDSVINLLESLLKTSLLQERAGDPPALGVILVGVLDELALVLLFADELVLAATL